MVVRYFVLLDGFSFIWRHFNRLVDLFFYPIPITWFSWTRPQIASCREWISEEAPPGQTSLLRKRRRAAFAIRWR
jgi:hypothetical protein